MAPDQYWYLMFYIGFETTQHAQIGLARSRDGVTGWERHPANPIILTAVSGQRLPLLWELSKTVIGSMITP